MTFYKLLERCPLKYSTQSRPLFKKQELRLHHIQTRPTRTIKENLEFILRMKTEGECMLSLFSLAKEMLQENEKQGRYVT